MNTKIGILCAGDDEAAPFFPLIQNCRIHKKAMLNFYEGKIEGIDTVTLFSGVCKVNAAIAAQILIDTYDCNAIIIAGTAGGMDETLHIFDTVVAKDSVYWDVAEDILTDFHPWLESAAFKADESLLSVIKDAVDHNNFSYPIVFGRMVTGETFIKDQMRGEINAALRPLSVDMETAAVAHVCYVNQIPYAAIRTITDTAAHSGVENFEKNCKKAAHIAADITRNFLKELYQKQRLS